MDEYSDYSEEECFESIFNEVPLDKKVKCMFNGSRSFMIKNKKVYIRANKTYKEKILESSCPIHNTKRSIYLEFPAKELLKSNTNGSQISVVQIVGAINCEINTRFDESTFQDSYCGYLVYTQNPNEYMLLTSNYRIIIFEMPENYEIIGFMKIWTSRASDLYFCGIIVQDAKTNKAYFVVVPSNNENNKCIEIKEDIYSLDFSDYEKYFWLIDDCKEQFIPDFILNKKYFSYNT